MEWKRLVARFAGPAVAAYFLHWGAWWFVSEAEQIIMSGLTRSINWLADLVSAPHIEVASWSAKLVAIEAVEWGVVPVALGLLIGWWALSRNSHPA